ncbi:MAG: DNA topoisomerase III [Verrucomicrobiota bacterium]|nr:DNA topoisomerase III [Verrucomicrobiota bacterium]
MAKVVKKKSAPKRKAPAKKTARPKAGLTQIQYALSDSLAKIVGGKKLTRPEIVKKLWAYIKSKKCQDVKNRRLIVPDRDLAEVLGTKPVDMLKMSGLLNKHLKKI